MEYTGESLVVITATSHTVIDVRDTKVRAVRGWMGPNREHHWTPRKLGDTLHADSPVIVTCIIANDEGHTHAAGRRS